MPPNKKYCFDCCYESCFYLFGRRVSGYQLLSQWARDVIIQGSLEQWIKHCCHTDLMASFGWERTCFKYDFKLFKFFGHRSHLNWLLAFLEGRSSWPSIIEAMILFFWSLMFMTEYLFWNGNILLFSQQKLDRKEGPSQKKKSMQFEN